MSGALEESEDETKPPGISPRRVDTEMGGRSQRAVLKVQSVRGGQRTSVRSTGLLSKMARAADMYFETREQTSAPGTTEEGKSQPYDLQPVV